MLKSQEFDWISCIGTGSFSKVYFATAATRATKEYAVKIIDKSEVIKLNAQESVFRERDIMARLVHSNICNLYFTFQDSRSLYFVLELCHSGSLFSLIQFYGHLKYKNALFYSSEIVSAICYLHNRNIVHCDLKPENILLGRNGHVKLADFGSAIEILRVKRPSNDKNNVKDVNNNNIGGNEIDSRRRENSGEFYCGTAEYSAPEILKRSVQIETGIDLWAIGCIVYQMLIGKLPFQGENEYFTYNKILNFDEKVFFNLQTNTKNNNNELNLNKEEVKLFEKLQKKDLFLFIKSLLKVTPKERLGIYTVDELQTHRAFKSIRNWNHVELNNRKAPKIPKEVMVVNSTNRNNNSLSFNCLQQYLLCCFNSSNNNEFSTTMNGGNNDNNKRRPSSTAVDDQAYFQLLYEDAGKS